jgi:uncharacterized membrane protein (DUF485 family)
VAKFATTRAVAEGGRDSFAAVEQGGCTCPENGAVFCIGSTGGGRRCRRPMFHSTGEKGHIMSEVMASKILNNPKYLALIKARDSLQWTLSVLVLVIYFGFILLVALAPGFITHPISETSVIPIGLLIGVGVILAAIALTGIYVVRANNTYDPMIQEIIREASK